MVTHPSIRRWALASFALITLALLSAADPTPPRPPATDRVAEQARAALRSGGFPWYDPASDDVRSIRLRPDPTPDPPRASSTAGGGGSGSWWWPFGIWNLWDAIVFLLFLATLIALGILVARYWKRFEPAPDAIREVEPEPPSGGAGEALPAALRPVATGGDLWAEADRRRQAGDLAGAVVHLFAHQLLSLSRLGLVRLVPGRTGRQLQRAVADKEFQALVLPTLRQFEAVYYGHRAVPPGEFALVWAAAESFQRRLAEQGSR